MRLLSVVCPNGLGHYRRTVSVLALLLDRLSSLQVELACEQWQVDRLADWMTSDKVWQSGRARLLPGLMGSSFVPSAQSEYGDGRLNRWLDRLADLPALRYADVVLSDNLAGALALRPDAVLAGSFLWSDVLEAAHPGSAEVQRFVEQERSLLERLRPPMLCVGAMAMPGVLSRTDAICLDWMCDPAESAIPHHSALGRRVAVLGGDSPSAAQAITGALEAVAVLDGWDVALPNGLQLPANARARPLPFRFSPLDFTSCTAIVCRPGMGTVQDCIAHAVPIVPVHEPGNIELTHIGQRLEQLGLGIYLGSDPDPSAIVAAVRSLDRTPLAEEIRQRMRALPKDGYRQAADWLVARLTGVK